MSRQKTSFVYGGFTVVMEINPVHPRKWTEHKQFPSDFDTSAAPYAYDHGAPNIRLETLEFPAISQTNVDALLTLFEAGSSGAKILFTWNDRQGVSRQARYRGMVWQQISPEYCTASLTLEVIL